MRISKRTLTGILLLGIVLLLGMLVFVFVKYRELSENPAALVEALPKGADIAIDDIRHTAVENGRKTWSLEAASANYSDSAQTVTFQDIRVVFYPEDGGEVTVTGNQGRLDTASNDIEVSGEVVIRNAEYELTTQKLHYDQAQRRIRIPVPVNIRGRSLALQADTMTIDLESESAHLEGSVKGVFSGKHASPF